MLFDSKIINSTRQINDLNKNEKILFHTFSKSKIPSFVPNKKLLYFLKFIEFCKKKRKEHNLT